jgi:hypothetical protein
MGCLLGKSIDSPTLAEWEFENLAPEAARRRVGLPDHAMLIADIERVSAAEGHP